jgi:hypothetical protein
MVLEDSKIRLKTSGLKMSANECVSPVKKNEPMATITRSELIRERLFECIHNSEIENDDLIKILEHLGKILNVKTLSQYARDNGLTYNGAKKRCKYVVMINNLDFYIDNL